MYTPELRQFPFKSIKLDNVELYNYVFALIETLQL